MAKTPTTLQIDLADIEDAVADAATPAAIETDIELDEETAEEVARLPKRATYNPVDGSVTYRMRYPRQLMRDGKVALDATTLVFRQPKANLVKLVLGSDNAEAAMVRVLSELTGISPPICRLLFDRLDARDTTAISDVISFFTGASRGSGKTG